MKRQFDFVVTLEHPGRTWIVLISQFLLLTAVLLVAQPVVAGAVSPLTLWPAVIVILLWGYAFLRRKAENPPSYRWALSFSALAIVYATGSFVLGALYVFAALALGAAAVQPEVGFNNAGLTINNLFPRHIEWKELNRVLIKDDILTIDFRNNKLYQKKLSEPITPELTEEFNQFCAERTTPTPGPSRREG